MVLCGKFDILLHFTVVQETSTNKMGRVLMTWERKILRIIYGPTYENGHWRIKTNQEM
jgi:hypothetical protein